MSIFRATVLTVALALLAATPAHLHAQSDMRSVPNEGPTEVTFHLVSGLIDAPVRVVHITLGDREAPLDTPVEVRGKWLRTLRITVQNISTKSIVTGSVTLTYPETGDGTPGKPVLAADLGLGRPPSHWYLRKDGSERPRGREAQETEIVIPPGGTMVFSYKGPDNSAADQDQAGAYNTAGKLTRINILPNIIFFADGSRWSFGKFYIPAPAPDLWKEAPATEFLSK